MTDIKAIPEPQSWKPSGAASYMKKKSGAAVMAGSRDPFPGHGVRFQRAAVPKSRRRRADKAGQGAPQPIRTNFNPPGKSISTSQSGRDF